mgnify:FL=1
MQQTTNSILMVRPTSFRSNEQTAVNNHYQKKVNDTEPEILRAQALEEFDAFVLKLSNIGVNVLIYNPEDGRDTPDSHFPNNWISFHQNGAIGLFPMFAINRRLERRDAVLDYLENEGFIIKHIHDYTSAEKEHLFLEGTGSLLLDRVNRKAYCALSERANEELLIEFCEDFEFSPIIFVANQTVNGKRTAIYHTNVMMCLGERFAVICLSSIDDNKERKQVIKSLKADGKEIIDISEKQVNSFAGNMLEVKGDKGESYLIMSESARTSLNLMQLSALEVHTKIVSIPLNTIETCGGGSARCMMAEVFLPKAF